MVIGGGVGGLCAAFIAAERGHDVTLYEASDVLGGNMRLAAFPPGKVISQTWFVLIFIVVKKTVSRL